MNDRENLMEDDDATRASEDMMKDRPEADKSGPPITGGRTGTAARRAPANSMEDEQSPDAGPPITGGRQE